MPYFPLHVISGYTFLSSTLKISPYVQRGKELSFSTLAIADENAYAFPEFDLACKNFGIQPVFGASFTFFYKEKQRKIYLYIQSEVGYRNFCLLFHDVKDGIYQGYFEKTEGLIAIVPALSSNFFTTEEKDEQTKEMLQELKKHFSKFYIGSECYDKQQYPFLKRIYHFADQYGFLTVAFPKTLCLKKEDGLALEILACLKEDSHLEDIEEKTTPYYLFNEKVARKIYREQDFDFFNENFFSSFVFQKKRGKLLEFSTSQNKKEEIYQQAILRLKAENRMNDLYDRRLKYELDVIEKMGYLDYFLIVQDYVHYAKTHHIATGPGRGSAAGSLISYALGITDIDPIQYNLLFERFLNPERISMPDIDMDFADYRREELIQYIQDRYGKDKVRNIITFQTIGPKQSIRDVGRVFLFNPSDINALCSSIGYEKNFVDVYKSAPAFRKLIEDEHFKKIASLARKIEGLPRQKGLHAAGILINNDPLNEVLPMMGDEQAPAPFEAIYLENLGFLKMDILGLRNLTIIENILKKWQKSDMDLTKIPLNDEETLHILSSGYTKGIFQLESAGITDSLKLVCVDSFEDIVAVNALYRPGPMKNIPLYAKRKKGQEKTIYMDPRLEPILKETYGVIVYQEQVMLVTRIIASFSLGKADILRRAISKKDSEKLASLKKDFIKGAMENGLSEKDSENIYQYILEFANYGFNKSHSVCYSCISYQMAYLKAKAPKEFFAALFDSQKSATMYGYYANELKHFSIKLLLPDINKSEDNFHVEEEGIRMPFNAIHSFPSTFESAILKEREKGPFTSITDFFLRMQGKNINEQGIVSLINAGAFDSFKYNRETLRKAISTFLLFAMNMQGIYELTEEERKIMEPKITIYKENISLKNQLEFEALGILLSGSLFDNYSSYFQNKTVDNIEKAYERQKRFTTFPALIAATRIIETKKNEEMELITCYDEQYQLKIIVFPSLFKTLPFLQKGDAILVTGNFSKDKRGISFIAKEIIKMEEKYE